MIDRHTVSLLSDIAHRIERSAKLWTSNFTVLQQLRDYTLSNIYRDRKSDTDRTAASRKDLRVDADHPAELIQQRSARVARVDGCVRLDSRIDGTSIGTSDGSLK